MDNSLAGKHESVSREVYVGGPNGLDLRKGPAIERMTCKSIASLDDDASGVSSNDTRAKGMRRLKGICEHKLAPIPQKAVVAIDMRA